jgi:hypothetical protein
MRRVNVPAMADVFNELDWYKAQIESATAANAVMKGDADVRDVTRGRDVPRLHERSRSTSWGSKTVIRMWPSWMVTFIEGPAVETFLLAVHDVEERGLVATDVFEPVLVHEQFALLVACEVLQVQVRRRGSAGDERTDGLLHVRDVDGLALREPVRDDAEAVEEIVVGPTPN